ncbi:MAG: site-specific integrase [Bacteroidales bacterium]|nr:site-specific integrase [Bacteroidales bacterium]
MKNYKQANIKIVYNRRNKLNTDGKARIDLDVSFGGKRRYVSTSFFVRPEEYDTKQKMVKNHPYAAQINSKINLQIRKIQDRELTLLANGNYFTIDDLLADEQQSETNFLDFAKREAARRDVEPRQKNAYKNLFANLAAFRGNYIPFDQLTSGFIKDFDYYLRSQNTPLHPNTIAKRHTLLKVFINAAIDEKLITIDPYLHFKSKRILSERFALTEQELESLEKVFCNDDTAILVRDIFLFGCYTGLRFQDIMALTPKSIRQDNNETMYLHTREQKTKKLQDLPLHELFNGKPIAIVNKYISKYRDTLFPSVTNQHANRILKSFAMTLQIDKPLTFHISRHTFGTIIAEKTGDPYLVQKLMNHSDIHTSMRYTHTTKNDIENKLSCINW